MRTAPMGDRNAFDLTFILRVILTDESNNIMGQIARVSQDICPVRNHLQISNPLTLNLLPALHDV